VWTAHNLERVADRVTNICERTIFSATGVMREIETENDKKYARRLIKKSLVKNQ